MDDENARFSSSFNTTSLYFVTLVRNTVFPDRINAVLKTSPLRTSTTIFFRGNHTLDFRLPKFGYYLHFGAALLDLVPIENRLWETWLPCQAATSVCAVHTYVAPWPFRVVLDLNLIQ